MSQHSNPIVRFTVPVALAASIGAIAFAGTSASHRAGRAAGRDAAKGAEKPASARKVTFARDIAPIIQSNCATCHRPGEVAPFTLTSFEDVKKHAKQIVAVTKSHFMPPWKAESHGEFVDERRLTDDQIAVIDAWSAAGSPMGDPKEMPAAPKYPAGWKLGPPDQIVGLPEPFKLDAEGRDVYRCFVVPSGTTEDKFTSALQVKPGNPAVVHHVIAYLDTTGAARKLDDKDPGPGYSTSGGGPGFLPSGFLGGWAPGNEPRHLPDGIGNLIPKGADIVLEVHYHKDGKPETDQTQVGIYYSKKPVTKRVRMLPIINPFFKIPAGAPNHAVPAAMPVFKNSTVLNITPHMHLLGRDMKVTVDMPDGAKKQLVNVPDWDFNWQITYVYKEPIKLPAGARINLLAHYDNSTANPKNPNKSPRDVTWGEQTTDEMCIAFIGYTEDAEDLTKGISGTGNGRRGAGGR